MKLVVFDNSTSSNHCLFLLIFQVSNHFLRLFFFRGRSSIGFKFCSLAFDCICLVFSNHRFNKVEKKLLNFFKFNG